MPQILRRFVAVAVLLAVTVLLFHKAAEPPRSVKPMAQALHSGTKRNRQCLRRINNRRSLGLRQRR